MLKKIMTAAAVTAAAVGAGAVLAAPAMAIGNDNGVNTVNGNGSQQIYGNQKTAGDMSPQLSLVQGTLNKPCIGVRRYLADGNNMPKDVVLRDGPARSPRM